MSLLWLYSSRQVNANIQPLLLLLLYALCQALYDGKWHQLKILVRPQQVSGFLDDREIRQVPLEPGQPIYINGKTQLSKRVRSNSSVPVKWKHRQTSVSSLFQWLLQLHLEHLSHWCFQQLYRWSSRSCVSTATLNRARERRLVRSTQW